MALTAKQENFCQCIAKGMTQSDAYRASYSVERMKLETIHRKAHDTMQVAKVAARVAQLKKDLARKELWTREQSVKSLKVALELAYETKSSTGITAAVRELNAMHGFNEPQKMDVRVAAVGAVVFAPHTSGGFSEYLPDADD